jgi:hypothetical protein
MDRRPTPVHSTAAVWRSPAVRAATSAFPWFRRLHPQQQTCGQVAWRAEPDPEQTRCGPAERPKTLEKERRPRARRRRRSGHAAADRRAGSVERHGNLLWRRDEELTRLLNRVAGELNGPAESAAGWMACGERMLRARCDADHEQPLGDRVGQRLRRPRGRAIPWSRPRSSTARSTTATSSRSAGTATACGRSAARGCCPSRWARRLQPPGCNRGSTAWA